MSKLSIEQRAHDIALLNIEINANDNIQRGEDPITFDLAEEYVKSYIEVKSKLEELSKIYFKSLS
ncbi:hypothetical protein ACWEWU_10845 [Staphylococcus xylosus]